MTEPRLSAVQLALLLAVCAGLLSCSNGVSAEQSPVLVGTVIHVFDGDTIKVRLDSGPIIVRLHSIDTPEHDQPWGPQAADALASRVAGRTVSLEVITHDSYDRLVADVFLGDESVNAWMVQQGDAWAYRHYLSDRKYCTWEGEARAAHHGIWSLPPSTWRAPWQWRAFARGEAVTYTDYSHETVADCMAAMPAHASSSDAHVAPDHSGVPSETASALVAATPPTALSQSGKCLIKGNISSSGRIYHVPGSDSYDDTYINESKGERWFCTEAEARAAGWRPPAGH